MQKPDLWSTEPQASEDSPDFTAACGMRLATFPTFLYSRMVLKPEAIRNDGYMKKIVAEVHESLLQKAREIRDELNSLDLGAEKP